MKHLLVIIFSLVFVSSTLANNTSDKNKKTLCGKVVDKITGEALSGVKVEVKGSNTFCYTDLNGNYMLSVPSEIKENVVANVVGYETSSMPTNELGYFKNILLSPIP